MHTEHDYDVLIAGAGPAGAHTALHLARAGRRVALLDSRHFPRKKPCGEFLSPACLPLLESLGLLDALLDSSAAHISGMNIGAEPRWAHGAYEPLGPFAPSHGHGLGVRRELLDAQAVAAVEREARATVLQGWQVLAPLVGATGRTIGLRVRTADGLTEELKARFVVGADGSRSRVARGLGWQGDPLEPARFALVARFEDLPNAGAVDTDAEVHVVGRDYFAACPIDAGLFTANLVVDGCDLPAGASAREELFYERLAGAPRLAARLGSARPCEPVVAWGPLRTRARRVSGPGAALVGDACGFVDPLTGEGLFFAMRGARLLFEAVHAALDEPRREPALLRRYTRRRVREFGPRNTLARLLQRGLRRPGVPARVVGTLARRPALRKLLMGLTGDYVTPRAAFSPRAWGALLLPERGVRPTTPTPST